MQFLENADSTAIHYRRFNLSPKDKYPAFSICFTGSELYWYRANSIFKRFGLRSFKFEEMLKGEEVFRHDYNYSSMLYNKIPVHSMHVDNVDTRQFYLKISDILSGLEFATDYDETSIRYGIGIRGKEVEEIPVSYTHLTLPTKRIV